MKELQKKELEKEAELKRELDEAVQFKRRLA